MVMEGEQNGVRPRNGVYCNVDWTRRPASQAEIEKFGDTEEEVDVPVFIAPEIKVPRSNYNMTLDWTQNEELHPFWFTKRAKPLTVDIPNMELIYLPVQQILAVDLKALVKAKHTHKPITEVAIIQYPCLVNTVVIEPGSELILKWEQQAVKGPAKQAKGKTAFDQIEEAQNKSKRAKKAASKEG